MCFELSNAISSCILRCASCNPDLIAIRFSLGSPRSAWSINSNMGSLLLSIFLSSSLPSSLSSPLFLKKHSRNSLLLAWDINAISIVCEQSYGSLKLLGSASQTVSSSRFFNEQSLTFLYLKSYSGKCLCFNTYAPSMFRLFLSTGNSISVNWLNQSKLHSLLHYFLCFYK